MDTVETDAYDKDYYRGQSPIRERRIGSETVIDIGAKSTCGVIVEPLRDRIVTGLLQASLDCLLRVILDGGPSRLFIPSDAKLLQDDLENLKTRILIDDLKEVSQGNRSKFGADSKTLLRILCHRSDNEASQFLKKQFKIPKSSS